VAAAALVCASARCVSSGALVSLRFIGPRSAPRSPVCSGRRPPSRLRSRLSRLRSRSRPSRDRSSRSRRAPSACRPCRECSRRPRWRSRSSRARRELLLRACGAGSGSGALGSPTSSFLKRVQRPSPAGAAGATGKGAAGVGVVGRSVATVYVAAARERPGPGPAPSAARRAGARCEIARDGSKARARAHWRRLARRSHATDATTPPAGGRRLPLARRPQATW